MPPPKLLSDCLLLIVCFLQFSYSTCGQLFSVSARDYCFFSRGPFLVIYFRFLQTFVKAEVENE